MAPQLVPEQPTVASSNKSSVPGLPTCYYSLPAHSVAQYPPNDPNQTIIYLVTQENHNACMAIAVTEHTLGSLPFSELYIKVKVLLIFMYDVDVYFVLTAISNFVN